MPGSPTNNVPAGALVKTWLRRPALYDPRSKILTCGTAFQGDTYGSHRKPALKLKWELSRMLSCTNRAGRVSRSSPIWPLFCENEEGFPSIKSARELPVFCPLNVKFPLREKLPKEFSREFCAVTPKAIWCAPRIQLICSE